MTATLMQARDEVQAVFQTAWKASTVSQDFPIRFEDVKYSSTPTDVDAWARITMRHLASDQVAIGGDSGSRRFRRVAVVTVQIFTKHGGGLTLNDQLVTIGRNAFEGSVTKPGQVIFKNVQINEVGQDGQWYQTNVLANFEYDEVR